MQIESTEASSRVQVPAGASLLDGELVLCPGSCKLVIVAAAAPESRRAPSWRRITLRLNEAELSTLAIDLVEAGSDEGAEAAGLDPHLLAHRLVATIDWAARSPETSSMSLGIYGVSTGAAAAVIAAANRPAHVRAIVARSGRPHLAGPSLGAVFAPSLFIVGERDPATLQVNLDAIDRMRCLRQMEVVAGASRWFEDPDTQKAAADLAVEWFLRYLGCTC